MRLLLAIALLYALTTACERSLAQDEFPYTATVKRDGATVHSGPAKVHYMTCRLKAGDEIEVYRHDPNGWLAIRPVEQDFSLVRARYVLANFGKGTGQVTSDDIRCWVGTESTEENEPLWQIRFRKGDRVRLKGKQQLEDTSGALHSWYEIAPPSGEFRWIHESALKEEAAETSSKADAVASNPIIEEVVEKLDDLLDLPNGGEQLETLVPENDLLAEEFPAERTTVEQIPVQKKSEWQQVDSSTVPAQTPKVSEPVVAQPVVESGSLVPKPFQPEKLDASLSGSIFPKRQHAQGRNERALPHAVSVNEQQQPTWQVASERLETKETFSHEIQATSRTVNQSTDDISGLDREVTAEPNRLGQFQSEPNVAGEQSRIADVRQSIQDSSGQVSPAFEVQLRAFEIALTQEVISPADQWQLAAYHDAAMQLSRSATSAQQRREVNRLLEKLDSFKNLQRRHQTINRVGYQSEIDSNTTSAESPVEKGETSTLERETLEMKTNNLFTVKPGDRQQRGADSANGSSVVAGTGTVLEERGPQQNPLEDEASIYDAEGWLSRLYTGDGRGQSAYAVQDESGNILQTILPAPGVNLDRYLNKEVGIIGRTGFNRKYNKPHVTANRVVELERHR